MGTEIVRCEKCKSELKEAVVCDGCGKVMRRSSYYGRRIRPGQHRLRRRGPRGFRATIERSGPGLGHWHEYDACSPRCFALVLYKVRSTRNVHLHVNIGGTVSQVFRVLGGKRGAS